MSAAPKVKKKLATPGAPGVQFKLTGARPFVELKYELTGEWPGALTFPAAVEGAHVKVDVAITEENLPRFDGEELTRRLTAAGAYNVRRVVPRIVKASAAPKVPALRTAESNEEKVAAFLDAAGLSPEQRTRVEAHARRVLREVP